MNSGGRARGDGALRAHLIDEGLDLVDRGVRQADLELEVVARHDDRRQKSLLGCLHGAVKGDHAVVTQRTDADEPIVEVAGVRGVDLHTHHLAITIILP